MTKTLYITRHGKSSWDFEDIADIDRPLSSRGIINACMMAEKLKMKGRIPEVLISSPAVRALHTAGIFIRTLGLDWNSLKINDNIYFGHTGEILEAIGQSDDRYSSVMIFGHNPAFTELANSFLKNPVDNIPTAGIITLVFPVQKWSELIHARPDSEDFDYPKKQ
jgi:phosphohistidine phosphatase